MSEEFDAGKTPEFKVGDEVEVLVYEREEKDLERAVLAAARAYVSDDGTLEMATACLMVLFNAASKIIHSLPEERRVLEAQHLSKGFHAVAEIYAEDATTKALQGEIRHPAGRA